MSDVRLYDVMTDRYLTDRAQIIDKLTVMAAEQATFSEKLKSGERGYSPSGAATALLERAAKDEHARAYLTWRVREMWDSYVQRKAA